MPATVLTAVAPAGQIGPDAAAITDPEIIAGYLSDASRMVGSATALLRPTSEAEIAWALQRARREGAAVTVVARQTSTTGASVPQGGWILSMEKMTRLLEIADGWASAQAGILLGELQREVARRGWLYPPDPTSRNECTLGASVACNASGARTFKYGPTRPYVRALRVVLPSGEVLALRRGECVGQGPLQLRHLSGEITELPLPRWSQPLVKHAAGYYSAPQMDAIDLFIGSEGTLGVITEVEVELLPRPEKIFSLMAFFPDEGAALRLVEEARALARAAEPIASAPSPRCLEWLDEGALAAIREAMPGLQIPEEARAGVFTEQECTPSTEGELLEAWLTLLTDVGAMVEHPTGVLVADTEARQEEFRRARHRVPATANERAAHNQMPKVGTDLAVPDGALPEMMALYRRAGEDPWSLLDEAARRELLGELGLGEVLDRQGLPAAWEEAHLPSQLETMTFGHVGDNHLHVNFLPTSKQGLALARKVYAQLTARAIQLGGSPSGEHGIGKIKRGALRALAGEEGLRSMIALKRALDPTNCLGRGNLFTPEDVAT